jgi:hypothetical protein
MRMRPDANPNSSKKNRPAEQPALPFVSIYVKQDLAISPRSRMQSPLIRREAARFKLGLWGDIYG